MRVLFFFTGGGSSGGGGGCWGGAPSPRLSLAACRVFSAPAGPSGPTSISVSATFPMLCDDASERDCASSSECRLFMVMSWGGHSVGGRDMGMCRKGCQWTKDSDSEMEDTEGGGGERVRVIMFWEKWQNSVIIRDRDQD